MKNSTKNILTAFKAYLDLTKYRMLPMVLITATIGFYLGCEGVIDPRLLYLSWLGIGLVAAGAAAINQAFEAVADAHMERTRWRPVASGRIPAANALGFGVTLVLCGLAVLLLRVNIISAFLMLLAAFLYDVVYTPLKKLTWLNTLIGAIPGALPPLCGWTAATGEVSLGGVILFLILFVWQEPHFFPIAWIHRDDYARAGFKMLAVVDPDGRSTFRQTVLYASLLLPVALLPYFTGMTGLVYFYGTIFLGSAFAAMAVMLAITQTVREARRMVNLSLIYLPALLILIVADAGF